MGQRMGIWRVCVWLSEINKGGIWEFYLSPRANGVFVFFFFNNKSFPWTERVERFLNCSCLRAQGNDKIQLCLLISVWVWASVSSQVTGDKNGSYVRVRTKDENLDKLAWYQAYFKSSIIVVISQRRKWQPTPEFLPGKSHEQRSLAGYI